MRKQWMATGILLLFFTATVFALTEPEAQQAWNDVKRMRMEYQEQYAAAQQAWEQDRSTENEQALITKGKELLHAALDEIDAWLVWKQISATNNPTVLQETKDAIISDVETNRAKIAEWREKIDAVQNRLQLTVTYLELVGKYWELLVDVGRNMGAIWSHWAELKADQLEVLEGKLRIVAGTNSTVIAQLDSARQELATARSQIQNAKNEYQQVVLPGTPLIRFGNGNTQLQLAISALLRSQAHLQGAFRLLASNQRGGSP